MSSQQSQRGGGYSRGQPRGRGGPGGQSTSAGAQRGGGGDRGGQGRGGYERGRDGQRGAYGGQSGGRARAQSGGDSRPGYSRDDRGRGFSRGGGRGRGGQRGRARSASPVRNDVRRIAKRVNFKPLNKKHGSEGTRVELISNLYPMNPINKKDDISVYQYDIEINRRKNETKKGKPQDMRPTKENYDNNKRIVEKMADEWIENEQKVLQPKKYGFDGNKILYSYIKLNIGSEQITKVVNINLDGYERTYDVKIQFARDVPIESLNCLNSPEDFSEGRPILDIALKDRDLTNENLVSVGRHLFDLKDKQDLTDKNCSLVFGHHKSIHSSECGLTVNVDRVTTVFRAVENEPLIEYLCREIQIKNRSAFGLNQLRGFPFTDDVIRFINNKIKNLRIYSNHIVINGRPQKRSHIIDRMIDKKPNEHSFRDDSGQTITLEVYFRSKYGKSFEYRNIPLIKIKGGTPENPKLLPAELCYVSPQKMSREMLSDNPDIQSEIVETSNSQTPLKRFEKIQTSVQTIINESQELMTNSGYKIDPNPIKLDGRELPTPQFKYKETNKKRDNYVLYETVPLNYSVFLNLSNRVKPQLSGCFDSFFKKEWDGMIDSAGRIGLTVKLPIIWNSHKPEYDYDLSTPRKQVEAFEKFMKTFNEERLKPHSVFRNTQLIFVSLSYINDVYNTVKHCSENESENKTGILTQCILDDSFIRPPKGYFYNFLRKTNAKLNQVNQVLNQGYRPVIFSKRPTMVVGADVTHSGYHNPQAGERVRTSIAGVVGSYDFNFTKYAAIVSGQTPNVEIIRDFDIIIGRLMNQFKKQNKVFPQIIVLFRDGVSESQLEAVMNAEVQLIYKAYQTLGADFTPKIVALVVQKRHHKRLILSQPEVNQRTGEELFNPRSGTVVDHTITNANLDEFILYSQKGMLGTSRPAKYVELINEIKLSADECQKFAYSMCFTYHRCSTPISIPIPVKYADDAAYRAKRHLDIQHMRYEEINPNETEQQKAIREETLLKKIDSNIKVNDNIVFLPYYC